MKLKKNMSAGKISESHTTQADGKISRYYYRFQINLFFSTPRGRFPTSTGRFPTTLLVVGIKLIVVIVHGSGWNAAPMRSDDPSVAEGV
jgi:hypothetical protein